MTVGKLKPIIEGYFSVWYYRYTMERMPIRNVARKGEGENTRHESVNLHVRKLQNPYFKAFFKLIRSTPHLWDQFNERYKRRDSLVHVAHDLNASDDEDSGGDHNAIRRLAPLWSAAATIPAPRAYLEMTVDAAASYEANEMREILRNGPHYVQELVIGAGVHGAIYNSEFAYHNNQANRFSVDASQKLGGQFRHYGGPALSMNTVNRPINRDIPNILDNPNANSFGPHAPLQLPEVSGKLYADNSQIGLVAAINQYLSSDTLVGVKVHHVKERIGRNTDSRPGRYEVELIDTNKEEKFTVFTDKVTISTGLGVPEYGFTHMDETTKKICESQDGRILTYADFLEEVGDMTNPFPLERFSGKRVVIVGGGHSGLTVAEFLSGLGPEYRGSVASFGGPSEITIVGTKFEDGEAFLGSEIPRYAQLASIMKSGKRNGNSKESLVQLFPGLRAFSLKEEEGADTDRSDSQRPLTLCCGEKGKGDGKLHNIEADIIIVTTGFNSTCEEIFKDILPEKAKKTTEDVHKKNKFFTFLKDVHIPGVEHSVARSLEGHANIVFIGPAANMPINNREIHMAEKYNRPTNEIALPNTAEDTWLYAQHIARGEHFLSREEEKNLPAPIFRLPQKRAHFVLPNVTQYELRTRQGEYIVFTLKEENVHRKFSQDARYDDLLRMAISAHVSTYRAEQPIDIKLKIEKGGDANECAITITPVLPKEYQALVQSFLHDDLTQAVIAKLMEGKHNKKGKLDIILPVASVVEKTQ